MKSRLTKSAVVVLVYISSFALASEQIEAQVFRLMDLWNGGDMSSLEDLIAEDYVGHLPPSVVPEALMGKDGFSFNVAGWRSGLPDLELAIIDTVLGEQKAVVRAILSATHSETFFGIPATGKALNFDMVFSYHFSEDGLLVEEWIDWDTTLELIQLGLFIPPGSN